jgi:hypothetical protein
MTTTNRGLYHYTRVSKIDFATDNEIAGAVVAKWEKELESEPDLRGGGSW